MITYTCPREYLSKQTCGVPFLFSECETESKHLCNLSHIMNLNTIMLCFGSSQFFILDIINIVY